MAPLDFLKAAVIHTAKEMAEDSKPHHKGVVRSKPSWVSLNTKK
jgi:hypothetical protein